LLASDALFYLYKETEVLAMRQSTPYSLWSRFQRPICFAMAAGLLMLAAGGTVAEAPTEHDNSTISDVEKPSRESVARELLEIRRRLGGSIVSDREVLQDIPPLPSVDQAEITDLPAAVVPFVSSIPGSQGRAKLMDPAVGTVNLLRDAAWQLDQSAEKLERSELYKQADALRNLAQQFRLDARAIRAKSGNYGVLQAEKPSS
jgi:hypothetical protein